MDRERLSRLLEEPARLLREDLPDLQALTEHYPWFSGGHLLRAAAEHGLGDVLFDGTLRTTAAHLPSRALLFDQLNRHVVLASTVPPVAHAVPGPVASAPVAAPVEMPSTAHGQDTSDIAERLLEQQVVEAALASSYVLEMQVPEPIVAPEALSPPVASSPRSTLPESPPLPTRRRFTDWLTDTQATGAQVPAAERPGPATPPMPGAGTGEIIDRFIQQQNPEPKPRTAFFSPQQAGKRSLEEHVELVTETLARIYERQGNVLKAIAAYERLALKYPEKSAYFAARAQDLRDGSSK